MTTLDQIAHYAHNPDQADGIKRLLGLQDKEWIQDHVAGRVVVFNALKGRSTALLQFNYDLGIELEILTFTGGLHWHMGEDHFEGGQPFLSHHGIHLDEGEPFPAIDAPLVQEMWTETHTNPYLVERGRHYHYRIHDCRPTLGVYLKFIKRIEG